jgi:uncharacterized phiE125 gp8 family phage protein
MALALTSPPAVEPLTLAEAKAHLRIDADEEDALIASLIAAGRMWLERQFGLALIRQGWSLYADRLPEGRELSLPLWPVSAVEGVTLHGEAEAAELAESAFAVDLLSRPARISFRQIAGSVPALRRLNGIEIAFITGFGETGRAVPGPIRQALLLLIADWYERREPVLPGYEPPQLPAMVAGLMAPYREMRL